MRLVAVPLGLLLALVIAVPRFPEEVGEGHAANHDILLLELDQWLRRDQTADGVQALVALEVKLVGEEIKDLQEVVGRRC